MNSTTEHWANIRPAQADDRKMNEFNTEHRANIHSAQADDRKMNEFNYGALGKYSFCSS